jgi:hypothetical protein
MGGMIVGPVVSVGFAITTGTRGEMGAFGPEDKMSDL